MEHVSRTAARDGADPSAAVLHQDTVELRDAVGLETHESTARRRGPAGPSQGAR